MYDGVFPHLIHKNLSKVAEDGVTNRLADIDGDEEPDVDIKDFVISVSGGKQKMDVCLFLLI